MQDFKTPLEAFLYWEENTPNHVFLNQPVNGKLISYTFAKAGEEARKIASTLKGYNLPEHSHVALLSNNCAHWIMSDIAIMMAGCVSIPLYPSLNAEGINQILVHSESKAIIIGKLDKFESQKVGIPDIPKISVGLYGNSDGELWEDIVLNKEKLDKVYVQKPDDLITIIYTSGTTGIPKGAMHNANNFMVTSYTGMTMFSIPNHCKLFSYLPLAHVAERLLTGTLGIVSGGEFYFHESLETFASDLEKCQPYLFFSVPRIWAKFQENILTKFPQKKLDVLLKIPIINNIFKKKLKQKLGLSKAKIIVSGAAPLSANLIKWYQKIGVTILQGYGMTEDCIVSHANLPNANKIGTVGRAVTGVKIKLSPEGEICIKNNCLFLGYFKAPDITASVFDDDGYFKTGDMGEYDHDGFLTITGRVKDQFKTDKGKYISPSYIELSISKNTDIEQICVVGTGIPQPIALITLSELGKAKSKEALSKSLLETVTNVNPKLEKHEKVEKVVIMKEEWTVDNGLITPTLKLKRNAIEKIHQPYYEQWFHSEEKVIFE
jgi:long-chain acyl-CoA synthetase